MIDPSEIVDLERMLHPASTDLDIAVRMMMQNDFFYYAVILETMFCVQATERVRTTLETLSRIDPVLVRLVAERRLRNLVSDNEYWSLSEDE